MNNQDNLIGGGGAPTPTPIPRKSNPLAHEIYINFILIAISIGVGLIGAFIYSDAYHSDSLPPYETTSGGTPMLVGDPNETASLTVNVENGYTCSRYDENVISSEQITLNGLTEIRKVGYHDGILKTGKYVAVIVVIVLIIGRYLIMAVKWVIKNK